MVRECPKCGLVNPPTTPRCDCGYEFASGQVTGLPPADATRKPDTGTRLLAGCLLVVIGVVSGVAIAVPLRLHAAAQVAEAVRKQEGYVCGLIVLPDLVEGITLGAVLGGLAGLVASLLLGRLRTRQSARRHT